MKVKDFWKAVTKLWFQLNWEEYEEMDRTDQIAFDFIASHNRERVLPNLEDDDDEN